MRSMDLGGLVVTDLGADDATFLPGEYDDGTGDGLGFSIGGLFKGIAKVAAAPVKLAAKGAKAAAKGVVAGGKFVVKHPYLLAPVALAIPGAPALIAGVASTAAKAVAKGATAPVKLAGKVLGIGGKSQAQQAADAQQQIMRERAVQTWYNQRTGEAVQSAGPPSRTGWKLTKPLRPSVAPMVEQAAAAIAKDTTATRDQKKARVGDLLKRLAAEAGGRLLQTDATGTALPADVSTTPTVQAPSGAGPVTGGGAYAPDAAQAEGEGGATLASMFQGPMPLLLMGGGLLAVMLFGRGGGGARRRNPPRRHRPRRRR